MQLNLKTLLFIFIVILLIAVGIHQHQRYIFVPTYEAPLIDKPQNRDFELVPHVYVVALQPGYTLSQHEATLGISLRPYIKFEFDQPYSGCVAYSARGIHDTLLAAVRADPGVTWVEVERKPELETIGLE